MKHQQHSKLTKPHKGVHGIHEISILGSHCSRIRKFAQSIAEQFTDEFPVTYVDADHATASHNESGFEERPFDRTLINKISHLRFNTSIEPSVFERSALLNSTHLTLVNGNHEKANHQIVIIDPNKEGKLLKRKDALTNVIGLISLRDEFEGLKHSGEGDEIPEYIKEIIPGFAKLPVIAVNDKESIKQLIGKFLDDRTPKIKGLILGGGKSTRMGVDKAFLDYHGQPQHEYLSGELSSLCEEVYVSCRAEQAEQFTHSLPDTFLHLGAYSGILSAFQMDPNTAWFSVACDVPLLDKETLGKLVARRDPSKLATCFYNSETRFPEPLITIWEPRAYPVLLHYMAMGYSCPRKVLINNDVEIVKLDNEEALLNANTKKEREKALSLLSKSVD